MIQGRPEKQTEPDRLPGQIVYRPAQTLADVIERIEASENESACRCRWPLPEPCETCPLWK